MNCHEWAQVCRCCGIERKQFYVNGQPFGWKYLVDGVWTTKRPDCRVIAADKDVLS